MWYLISFLIIAAVVGLIARVLEAPPTHPYNWPFSRHPRP